MNNNYCLYDITENYHKRNVHSHAIITAIIKTNNLLVLFEVRSITKRSLSLFSTAASLYVVIKKVCPFHMSFILNLPLTQKLLLFSSLPLPPPHP